MLIREMIAALQTRNQETVVVLSCACDDELHDIRSLRIITEANDNDDLSAGEHELLVIE